MEQSRIPVLPFAMRYDSTLLEDLFNDYRSTEVKGRGTLSLSLEVDQVNIGTKIATQKIEARTLKVKYILYYDDREKLQDTQRKLKQFLYREEDVEISFMDDPQIFYYGRLSKFDEEDLVLFNGYATGYYEIYCSDPRRYSKLKENSTKENALVITTDSPVQTTPERIALTMTTNSSVKITNKNTNKVISITGAAIYTGNKVEFDFDKGKVYVNGADKTEILDLVSDFENFYVSRGDELVCNGGKDVKVYVKEVYL